MKNLINILKWLSAAVVAVVLYLYLGDKDVFKDIARKQKKKNKDMVKEIEKVKENDKKINDNNSTALDELADKYS